MSLRRLRRSQIVNQVEGIEQHRGNWNRPVDAAAAFLEGFENDPAFLQVYPVSRQCQRLGDAAAAVSQRPAKRSHLTRRIFSGFDEGCALVWGQILALAVFVVKGHIEQNSSVPFNSAGSPRPVQAGKTYGHRYGRRRPCGYLEQNR